MKIKYAFSTFSLIVGAIFSSSTILAQNRITAAYFKSKVDSVAHTYANNVQLGSVYCTNLDSTGKSNSWHYVYLRFDSTRIEYHFTGQNNQITFDSTYRMRVGIGVIGASWIDSDSAYAVADRSGGANIRKRFPSCVMMASLGWDDLPDNMIRWWIEYKCSDSTRTITINATSGTVVSVKPKGDDIELIQFSLYQNYPNPFNPTTTISFTLPRITFVSVKIFDISGREIATIVNEELVAGNHSCQWNAVNASSGIYFYRLETKSFTQTKKLILLH